MGGMHKVPNGTLNASSWPMLKLSVRGGLVGSEYPLIQSKRKFSMRMQHQIISRMTAEIQRMARIYFAPLMAGWQTWKHGGGYVHQLLSLYRQGGIL